MEKPLVKNERRPGEGLWLHSLSPKALGRVCLVLFVLSLIPLIAIALYNYPADDDFTYGFVVAQRWAQTHSLWQVVLAIGEKAAETYQIWQGNFVSNVLFNVSPLIFGVQYYFLSNWAFLALLCLSVGYLLKGALTLLKAGRPAFWIVYGAVMTLTLQFMPSIGYSVYWHNGGIYTVTACFLFLLEGVLARCLEGQSRGRAVVRGGAAALLGFLIGGSFYGPMLGALVLVLAQTVWAWVRHARNRVHCLIALLFLLLAMAISVAAPGNLLRQERTGEALGPMMAVLTAVKDSFDVAAGFLRPQLLAALMLIIPALWQPLQKSPYAFRHPLWAAVALYGLFSASLVPGVFTGFGYTTERYYNVIYFYFLMLALGCGVYAEGAFIRLLERRRDIPLRVGEGFGQRYTALYLLVCLGLLLAGGLNQPLSSVSSLSAARSLLNGEASRFRQEMSEREYYLLVTPEKELTEVEPLSVQPQVFKEDKLPWQGVYGRELYMKWYFELMYYADQWYPRE